MSPKLVLTYFEFPALGEPVRLALAMSGQPWEDKRISMDEFKTLKPSEYPPLRYRHRLCCRAGMLTAPSLLRQQCHNRWTARRLLVSHDTGTATCSMLRTCTPHLPTKRPIPLKSMQRAGQRFCDSLCSAAQQYALKWRSVLHFYSGVFISVGVAIPRMRYTVKYHYRSSTSKYISC